MNNIYSKAGKSTFKTIGASSHSNHQREFDDFYATEPKAADLLIQQEQLSHNIWEPACGGGHLSERFKAAGHNVKSTDLIYRGYGIGGIDFLKISESYSGDIITNPPYKFAKEFIVKALDLVNVGNKVCMFLKVQFMEGKGRKYLFTTQPPIRIYVSSSRINCAKNGDFSVLSSAGGGALAYAWYVWEKGFTGTTSLKWIN